MSQYSQIVNGHRQCVNGKKQKAKGIYDLLPFIKI